MTSRPWTRGLERGLFTLGLLALALWSRNYLAARSFQQTETMKLEAALGGCPWGPPNSLARAAAFTGPAPSAAPGESMLPVLLDQGVLGEIVIPRLGITAIVAEGVDAATLGRAVGHVSSTALPGGPGNCALAGHRDTFLRGLGGVRNDDLIRVVTLGQTYTYRVEWGQVVEPYQVEVLDSTAARSLTLITCYPFEFVGHAPKRFVVRAREVE